MKTKISQGIIAGILGTAAMTVVMFMAPMMGIPKMNAAEMLSMMTGTPVITGWIIHFIIGTIFAMAYSFIFMDIVKRINNKVLKGTIFGLSVFVFAQIAMAIMGAMMGGMPPMEGSMILMLLGSILGHIIYGVVVVLVVKET